MMAKGKQQAHEAMLPQQKSERQGDDIEWNRNDGLDHVADSERWRLGFHGSGQQGSFYVIGPAPSGWRKNLKDIRIGGPDEGSAFFDLAAKEVRI